MAEITWEKSATTVRTRAPKRLKFVIASAVLLGAMAFLIISGTANGGKYFITINDMLARSDIVGKSIKVTGAVLGSTIHFDANTNTIYFTMANVTDNGDEIIQQGGLAKVLHMAVQNTSAKRIDVVVRNQAMPDLLQDEAQAILTGKLGSDGIFYADDINLKCPSKYQGDMPKQAQ